MASGTFEEQGLSACGCSTGYGRLSGRWFARNDVDRQRDAVGKGDEVDPAVGSKVFGIFGSAKDDYGLLCSRISNNTVARLDPFLVFVHEQQLICRVVALELLYEEGIPVVNIPRQMAVRVQIFQDVAARLLR